MWEFFKDAESFKSANGYIIDDIWYPRVTKIVSIKAKPALYRFYGEAENFQAGQQISQQSATEGSLVHETVEAILLGQKPEIDASIAPAINAFRKFLEQKSVQTMPEYVERRIFSPDHRYAGTVDALALIDGKFGVLDIKTSQAIYRDYNLQTAAYMEALKSGSGAAGAGQFHNLQTRWILKIDQIQVCLKCGAVRRQKGGREKISFWRSRSLNGNNNGPSYSREQMQNCQHEWSEIQGDIEFQEFPYWQNDFEAFLGAKKLWEWENEFWLKKIGYI